ncbi:energy-coupling factor transporter ATPase [Trueperella pyogenes]|uniref:ABC transporter ATP-binding protein n=1 Tax=Trueperella pyogenes TaxID=1661 RepID=UPI00345DFD2E
MKEFIIDAENLGFMYKGSNNRQLSHISVKIKAGERVAVMGATGAGKTTFAMMLNGIIPHHHPGDLYGKLCIRNKITHEVGIEELVTNVGLVMQDPEAQLTARCALDDAAVGPANLGLPRDDVWSRATRALCEVGLSDLEDRDTSQMSGGQQQRLAIAGILAMTPDILVLDEPTSELDPAGTREIYRIIEEQCSAGRTVVLIDHDSDRVVNWADKLLVLSKGEAVYFGPPDEFFRDEERVRQAQLRQPAKFELLSVANEVGLLNEQETSISSDELLEKLSIVIKDATASQKSEFIGSNTVTPSPEKEGPSAIEVHGLAHRYQSGVLALDNVSIDIASGDFVALLGTNGAGKTTFARHLVNLLHPTAGEVLINGSDTAGRKVHELASEIGYVFQNPDHQIFANSVFDEVAFGLRNFGFSETEIPDRVYEVLSRVHLEEKIDVHPFTLGRGERQRVAVASVLALKPEILVIDEPTTGQDWNGAVTMLELVRELNAEGKTIVMITHDMLLASLYARRAVVFQNAKIALDVPMSDLFADSEVVRSLNLEVPAITDLTSKLHLGNVYSRAQLHAKLERIAHAS